VCFITGMTPHAFAVRVLHTEDAAAFRALRLRALREEPTPFLATYEEEVQVPVEEVAARLASSRPDTAVLGAFREEVLVGTLGFYRQAHTKARHRVSLWGMYVAPEERRRGVGRALLDQVIADVRALGDVNQIELFVATTEASPRRLYRAACFGVQGMLHRAQKEGDRYVDEELLILRLDRS
jgi:ribosomal protein S18 acetylase RimI-like enzyme